MRALVCITLVLAIIVLIPFAISAVSLIAEYIKGHITDEGGLYIKIYADNEPSVIAEKIYQIRCDKIPEIIDHLKAIYAEELKARESK